MYAHLKTQYSGACIPAWLYSIKQYVSSRILNFIATLIHSFSASPIGACALTIKILSAFFLLAISASELLFLLHVRAVYANNKFARHFFAFLWVCTTASRTTPLSTAFFAPWSNIGPTNYCIGGSTPPYVGATVIVPFVNDTVLFLSLAWRLQDAAYIPEQEKAMSRGFSVVAGRYLPRMSRALLQNGQAYFLCVN